MDARVAGPPSPAAPTAPIPAMVPMVPLGHTFRTRSGDGQEVAVKLDGVMSVHV